MAYSDVTQVEVLASLILRLQTALSLTDRQCYEVARPDDVPVIPVGGSYFLTVAVGGGTFEPEEQAAGNITEDAEVYVTAYTRIKQDSTGHDRYLLVDDARGLLAIKKLILSAVCGQDLLDEDGNTFLRQWLHVRSCTAPNLVDLPQSDKAFGSIQLTLGVIFDWTVA
jgi:hypothetical protein